MNFLSSGGCALDMVRLGLEDGDKGGRGNHGSGEESRTDVGVYLEIERSRGNFQEAHSTNTNPDIFSQTCLSLLKFL